MGLKERQEAAMRERLQNKKKQWDDWEQQVEEEERLRRQQSAQGLQRRRAPAAYPNEPTEQYQKALEVSDSARLTKEQQLDEIQRRLQQRVQNRQRRSDRWMPAEYQDVVIERAKQAAEEQKRAAAREARRRQEEERMQRNISDANVVSQFLQGRVRRKVSQFADMVDEIQQGQDRKDPYRARQDDDVISRDRRRTSGRQDGGGGIAERAERPMQDDFYEGNGSVRDPYLPVDVVRVARREPDPGQLPSSQTQRVWSAGVEGGILEERAEDEYREGVDYEVQQWEDVGVVEDGDAAFIADERRWEQQEEGGGRAAALPPRGGKLRQDEEFIDW